MIKFKDLTAQIQEAFDNSGKDSVDKKKGFPSKGDKKKKNPFVKKDSTDDADKEGDEDEEDQEDEDDDDSPVVDGEDEKDANEAQVGERPEDDIEDESKQDTTVGDDGESIYSLDQRMQHKMKELGYDEDGEYVGKDGGDDEDPGFDAVAGGETDPDDDGEGDDEDQDDSEEDTEDEDPPVNKKKKVVKEDTFEVARLVMDESLLAMAAVPIGMAIGAKINDKLTKKKDKDGVPYRTQKELDDSSLNRYIKRKTTKNESVQVSLDDVEKSKQDKKLDRKGKDGHDMESDASDKKADKKLQKDLEKKFDKELGEDTGVLRWAKLLSK